MGLFSQIPVVQTLVTPVTNASGLDNTGLDAALQINLGAQQPAAPVLDLGATLGSSGAALAVDLPLLDTVTNALSGAVDTTSALGSAPLLDGLSIAVDLDTSALPALNLDGALGASDPLVAIDAQILEPIAPAPSTGSSLSNIVGSVLPDVSLDVNLEFSTGTPPAPTPVDPTAPTPADPTDPAPVDPVVTPPVNPTAPATGSDPDLSPTPDLPTLPSIPDVDVEIDIELGGGTGGTPSPSTGGDPAPVDPTNGGTPSVPSTGGTLPDAGTPSAPVDTGGVPGGEVGTGIGGSVGWIGGDGNFPSATGSVGTGAAGSTGEIGGGLSLAASIDWGARDWIEGNDGNNTLMGLSGNDTIYGLGGDDALFGNQNDDRLFGGFGNDTLHGGRDNDFVSGDEGDDQIWGDYGDDTLEGGDGADMFCFDIRSGNDIILDFNAAEGDRLNFQGQDYAIHDMSGTAVITLSGGGSFMLSGVSVANLDAYIVG